MLTFDGLSTGDNASLSSTDLSLSSMWPFMKRGRMRCEVCSFDRLTGINFVIAVDDSALVVYGITRL